MTDFNDNVIIISDTDDDDDDDDICLVSDSFKNINVPDLLLSPSKSALIPPEVLLLLKNHLDRLRTRYERRIQLLQEENKATEVASLQNFIDGFSFVNFETLLYGWSSATYKFYLNLLRNTLPDPRNLSTWKKIGDGRCALCGNSFSGLIHILSACPTSLNEGRFSYRHDAVLEIIREAMSLALAMSNRSQKDIIVESKLFSKSGDWQLIIDKNYEKYTFPRDLFPTSLRPDILVYSKNLKRVVLVELSVPWENNVPIQHMKKTNKYAHIIEGLRANEYTAHFYALEVSIKGLPTKLLYNFFRDLGLTEEPALAYLNRICKKAIQASHYIWVYRSSKWNLNSGTLVPFTPTDFSKSDCRN